MPQKYARHVSRKTTPQTQPLPGAASRQHANDAGGFVFDAGADVALNRFLILGTMGGTYYVGEKELTIRAVEGLERVFTGAVPEALAAVEQIAHVSESGRAPKNDPAIFALALATKVGAPEVKAAALAALPRVCRIGTHLFQFADACTELDVGWGRSLRRAVAAWYNGRDGKSLVYQLTKYASREGWSHRDVLRLAHAKPKDATHDYLFKLSTAQEGGKQRYERLSGDVDEAVIRYLAAIDTLKTTSLTDYRGIAALIKAHRLPREVLPTELLNRPEIWEALLDADMPYTALIRNLGNLSKCGLLKPLSNAAKHVVAKLSDAEALKKARVHPMALLIAQRTYGQGHGLRGKGEWTAVGTVVDALEAAFYASFANVVPMGKRVLLGVDWSGSMGQGLGDLPITVAEAAACMALVTARTEPECEVIAFATSLKSVSVTPKSTLASVAKVATQQCGEGTDCAVPVAYAIEDKLDVDAFLVYTDGETWAGPRHVVQVLDEYRKRRQVDAKFVTVAMTVTKSSLTDPQDKRALNVAGFDAATPEVVSTFVRSL